VEHALAALEEANEAEADAGSPHRWRMADSYAVLSERGWQGKDIADRCGVSRSLVSQYLKCVRIYQDKSARPRFTDAFNEALGRSVHYSSETPEWETPQDLFDVLNAEFGFTLDVCATSENAKCERYFTQSDDGLEQDWDGIVWMNPPYGKDIPAWMEKAAVEGVLGIDGCDRVVCLVPARTDTNWWWDYCRLGEIRLLKGRLQFGDSATGAPFPSAVVVFGRDVEPRVIHWERDEAAVPGR